MNFIKNDKEILSTKLNNLKDQDQVLKAADEVLTEILGDIFADETCIDKLKQMDVSFDNIMSNK